MSTLKESRLHTMTILEKPIRAALERKAASEARSLVQQVRLYVIDGLRRDGELTKTEVKDK